MTTYEQLLQTVERHRERSARFVRAAFHLHSPDSYDWNRGRPDVVDLAGIDGKDAYLNRLVDAGLDVACITDHMRAEYACALSDLAAARGDITVFPGMEISCTVLPAARERIHILVVFPAGTQPDVFERLFHSQPTLPSISKRSGREEVRFDSLSTIREQVDAAGGLFVLAHIDQQPRGHRAYVRSVRAESGKMFGVDATDRRVITEISNEYAEHLVALRPHAVEVMKAADRHHYWEFRTQDGASHGFPCVARSDHHSLDDFGDIEAMTHVKVSNRDLSCFKEALTFHSTRVRFSDDVPACSAPRILGVRIRGAGLFADSTVAFSENLTCLIGARGCGKSTVVEAMRYVLGQRPLLEDAFPRGHSYADLAKATQNANLVDTEIELIYERDGERHVLSATFDPDQSVASRAFSLDGHDLQIPACDIATRYPARIFSWGELETLGREPALQRSIVDRLADGLPDLQAKRGQCLDNLRENRAGLAQLRTKLEALTRESGSALLSYRQRKAAYEILNTEQVRELFDELDRSRQRINLLNRVITRLEETSGRASNGRDATLQTDVNAIAAGQGSDASSWWHQKVAPGTDIAGLETVLDRSATAGEAEVHSRITKLTQVRAGEVAAATQHEEAIRQQTQADSDAAVRRDQRETARRNLEESAALRTRYLEALGELFRGLAARGLLLEEYAKLGGEISAARRVESQQLVRKLSALQIDGEAPLISVDVEEGQDSKAVEAFFTEFLNVERGGQYKSQRLPERLATISPTTTAFAILWGQPDLITGDTQVTPAEAQRLISAVQVFRRDSDGEIILVSPHLEDVLTLQEQSPDDLVRITADDKPVDELSPGGRSSVMLPLVALSDEAPLIVDQPEDNLDNRVVGRMLSSILAKLKERRQIIVTTHNPNIVVGGDAEQVVVMHAPDSRSAAVETTGSIDDGAVVDAVIKIMEGGKDAFQERHRRYSAHAG